MQAWVAGQPGVVQFLEILVLTDVCQYWVHRAFHRVPLLWRFHEIHHSAETMDWIAGARLHLVDVAVTRGLTYVPIYVLGFDQAALVAYVVFVSVQATFIHANVRFEFGPLAWLLATPRFHHWHHGIEPEAVDKNFAIHLPVLDWLFGTFHLPKGRWPSGYGVQSDRPVPDGFMRQLAHPFRRAPNRGERPADAPIGMARAPLSAAGSPRSVRCRHRGRRARLRAQCARPQISGVSPSRPGTLTMVANRTIEEIHAARLVGEAAIRHRHEEQPLGRDLESVAAHRRGLGSALQPQALHFDVGLGLRRVEERDLASARRTGPPAPTPSLPPRPRGRRTPTARRPRRAPRCTCSATIGTPLVLTSRRPTSASTPRSAVRRTARA